MKKVFTTFKILLITILVIISALFIYIMIQTKINPDKIPNIFGYKPFIVLSGSMEKEFYKGDLIIIKNTNKNNLVSNDVIAFRDKKGYVVTHRIIKINSVNGKKEFITKGDNNNAPDAGYTTLNNIEGKYVTKISGMGNVLLFLKKPISLVVIIIIIILAGTIWILVGNNNEEDVKNLKEKDNDEFTQDDNLL